MGDTITIKKDSLWKYTTFALAAIIIIGSIVIFSNNEASVTGNAVNVGNAEPSAKVDLSIFLKNPSIYPSIGPDDAKTTVIEFSDFQCPFCAMASGLSPWTQDANYATRYGDLIGVAQKIQEKAVEGDVRFVYVSMSFLGQESIYAAQAALCANQQGKFWEMHDAIFTAHDGEENNGKYTKDNLKKIAEPISGIDISEFSDCLDNDKTLSDVRQAATEASTAASGTPTFYVNGQKVSASWQQISQMLS